MSWLYLPLSCFPASACSEKVSEQDLRTWALAIAPVSTLSGKLTQQQSWLRAWKKARWMRHLSGPTLPLSMQEIGVARWIASLPDSRAKTFQSRADAQDLTASAADFSLKSHGSQPIAVRGSSFWRTSQASLLPPPPLWTRKKANSKSAQPPESWENWPTSGGMRNGSLFQRPMWVPATDAQGGSASRGEWMTPNVPNGGRHVPPELVASKGMTADGQKRTVGLESQSKYWLTPHGMSGVEAKTGKAGAGGEFSKQVTNWTTPTATERSGQGERNSALTLDVKYWSTPKASDGTKGGPNQAGSKGDLMLPSMACQWPTPAARDHKGVNSEQHATVTGGGRKHMDQLANFVAYSPLVQTTQDGPESLSDSPRPPRHLNPLFGAWLMGWTSTWAIAEPHASSALETELFRSQLRSQLSCLLDEPASLDKAQP